jgi:small subunit ribosomal protein S2
VIPGNDDAIRSGSLMCRVIADAVVEGRFIAEHRRKAAPPAPEDSGPSSAPRPRRAAQAAAAAPAPAAAAAPAPAPAPATAAPATPEPAEVA